MGHNHKSIAMMGLMVVFSLFSAQAAFAGQPVPWQMDLQDAVTPVMEFIVWFERFTLLIIFAIVVFVTALLAWVMMRYRASKNKVPSKTTHNTAIEIIWTVVPILILVVIAVPSFRLLAKDVKIPETDLTIKTTGYQWYWGYEYPDYEDLSFDSYMLRDNDRQALMEEKGLSEADIPRLLAVDHDVVVPVNKVVRLQITAADVIHAFAMPAFGLKMDAIPGRLNETWFKAEKEGIYYGQCSELCGKDHAFMPIAIRVVSEEQFAAWTELAKTDIKAAQDQLMASIARNKAQLAQVSQ
jgi:cytochrome c oxidase subunit 2